METALVTVLALVALWLLWRAQGWRSGLLAGLGCALVVMKVLGVDFDPDAVKHARQCGHDALFGDASDPEFVAHLPWSGVRWAISAVPEHGLGVTHEDPRISLLTTLYAQKFAGQVAVAAHSDAVARQIAAAGADVVLRPYDDAAAYAAALVLGRARPDTEPRQDAPEVDQKELAL
jgi:Trk K+ transport system NAD-binding subunit